MSDNNGSPIQAVRSCGICGNEVDLNGPHRKLRRPLIAGHPDPKRDPIIGYRHEHCALKQDMDMLQAQNAMLGQTLTALVKRLGGEVKVTVADLRDAAQGPPMDIEGAQDGTLTLRTSRVILAKG